MTLLTDAAQHRLYAALDAALEQAHEPATT